MFTTVQVSRLPLWPELQVSFFFVIEIPVYFASCSNTFSRMLWRERVLQCLGERSSISMLNVDAVNFYNLCVLNLA
jgi:hypothetical protein